MEKCDKLIGKKVTIKDSHGRVEGAAIIRGFERTKDGIKASVYFPGDDRSVIVNRFIKNKDLPK